MADQLERIYMNGISVLMWSCKMIKLDLQNLLHDKMLFENIIFDTTMQISEYM